VLGAAADSAVLSKVSHSTSRVRCSWPLRPDLVQRMAMATCLPGVAGGWLMPAPPQVLLPGAPDPGLQQAARFLPLSSLFPNPAVAFTPDAGAWMFSYARACEVSALVDWGVGAGIGSREAVKRAVQAMVQAGAPLDPGLLLDVCASPF
jgi:hypothetical protein